MYLSQQGSGDGTKCHRIGRVGRRRGRRGGFTLAELLVVVGIIAVLIAMLLPALSRARYQAQCIECKARLRDFSASLLCYAVENRGYFPRFDIAMQTGRNTGDVANRFYVTMRQQFRRPHQTFYCPTAAPNLQDERFAFTYTTDVNSNTGFVIIGYSLWVPRAINGVMTPPTNAAGGMTVYDSTETIRGPIRAGEKLCTRNPLVSDAVLTKNITPYPGPNDISRLTGAVYTWNSQHQLRGKLESANIAYSDGHIDRIPAAELKPRYLGGVQGIDLWNWR